MIEAAIICMALNVYYEARSEPVSGQQAVALVTMNRAKGDPSRVCDVVFAPRQFSWTSAGTDIKRPSEVEAWKTAVATAKVTINGKLADFTRGATHYHERTVRPIWRHALRPLQLVSVGRHVFYCERDKSKVTCPRYN